MLKTILFFFVAVSAWAQTVNQPSGSGSSGTVTSATIAGTPAQIAASGTCTITTSGTCTLSIPSVLTLPGTINKLTLTPPTTGATLTLADGSSHITVGAFASTFTFTGTTGVTFPTSGTLATTTDANFVKGAAGLTVIGIIPYVSASGTLAQDVATPSINTTTHGLCINLSTCGAGTGGQSPLQVAFSSGDSRIAFEVDSGSAAVTTNFNYELKNSNQDYSLSYYWGISVRSSLVVGFASGAAAQTSIDTAYSRVAANVHGFGNGTPGDVSGIAALKSSRYTAVLFANLATAYTTNGDSGYCSDCTVTSGSDDTCAGSGSGADVMRLNGVYRCRV